MELRLDRIATLYLISPYLRMFGAGDRSVPILMYHSITDQTDSSVHAYYRTATSPTVFDAQMKHLRAKGFRSCSIVDAMNRLQSEESTVEKLVVITFDDGYSDFYRQAFPVLNQYGFSATVFLPTAHIGESAIAFKGKECLTWGQVRELKRNGVLFGSHTVTHPQLRELSWPAIREEVNNSKRTIEDKLGTAVDTFAYPFAFPQADTGFQKELSDSLREAGYQNGVCTVVGRANAHSNPLFLQRLPVNSCDDDALFEAKLAGAYDWISTPQQLSKTLKARVLGSPILRKYNVSKELPEVQ